jgi:RHS repeat-associated protein
MKNGKGPAELLLPRADGLGSITEITNQSGTAVQRYTYSSFGEIESQLDANFAQVYSFTSREFENETGTYFYRARQYDPTIGRFIQEDPIRFIGGVNSYSYLANKPINLVDPLGLFESPWYLRAYVPGQVPFDNFMTALENGDYYGTATNAGLFVAEDAMFFAFAAATEIGPVTKQTVTSMDEAFGLPCGPFGTYGPLFGRNRFGIFNRSDIIRVGWSWYGEATGPNMGRNIFRIAIGSERSPVHLHAPLNPWWWFLNETRNYRDLHYYHRFNE